MSQKEQHQIEQASRRAVKAIEIAKLYYEESMSEQQIASRMGLSRPTVHRMLSEALEKGLVHVKVIDTTSAHEIFRMRDELKKEFKLNSVHIAPDHYFYEKADSDEEAESDSYSEERLLDVALLAGRVFLIHLRALAKKVGNSNEGVVAVGPGVLIKTAIEQLPQESLPHLHVVPTNGYLYEQATEYSANKAGALLVRKIGATFHWLPCIGMMKTKHEEIIKQLPVIGEALQLIPQARLVLAGVRDFRYEDFERFVMLFPSNYTDKFLEYERRINEGSLHKPLGLVCDHPFVAGGSWNAQDTEEVVIGLRLEQMQKLVKDNSGIVICAAVAERSERVQALRVALEDRYFNVLVTDEFTARQLLQQNSSGKNTKGSSVDSI